MTPVERAAVVLMRGTMDGLPAWFDLDGQTQAYWLSEARAALSAATEDVDGLARVIGSIHKRETETFGQYDRRRARAVVAHLTKGTNDE